MRKSVIEIVCDVCLGRIQNTEVGYGEFEWWEYNIAGETIDVCSHCQNLLERLVLLGVVSAIDGVNPVTIRSRED